MFLRSRNETTLRVGLMILAGGLVAACDGQAHQPAPADTQLTSVVHQLSGDGLNVDLLTSAPDSALEVPTSVADHTAARYLPAGAIVHNTVLARVHNVATKRSGLCWLVVALVPHQRVTPSPSGPSDLPGSTPNRGDQQVVVLDAATGYPLFIIGG
jgi:hypothetical protein